MQAWWLESRTMDIIKLTNIVFYAHHGYYEAERELGQRFELDIEVTVTLGRLPTG